MPASALTRGWNPKPLGRNGYRAKIKVQCAREFYQKSPKILGPGKPAFTHGDRDTPHFGLLSAVFHAVEANFLLDKVVGQTITRNYCEVFSKYSLILP